MEIERKFLIDCFPSEYPLLMEAVVYQGYLSVKPVVRIRSTENKNKSINYKLCFKGEGTLVRQEVEMDLTHEVFEELKSILKAPMIRKDYKVYQLTDGRKLECSLVDQGTPEEFMFAEVEFDSIEQANQFVPPSFLLKEVTEERSYSMGNYWKTTREKEKE